MSKKVLLIEDLKLLVDAAFAKDPKLEVHMCMNSEYTWGAKEAGETTIHEPGEKPEERVEKPVFMIYDGG